jgi:hypothetical protein
MDIVGRYRRRAFVPKVAKRWRCPDVSWSFRAFVPDAAERQEGRSADTDRGSAVDDQALIFV